ncbi:MAG: site-2 protease family protein [Spirochaetia bacterium]
MILTILLGIIGLGIVILIHETGHFIAARLAGIEVEAFSLGWGRKLISWKRGKTEYRISMLPIGGYCKMKGEHLLREAWQEEKESIPKEPGSFFAAPPWKRILVSLSGPAANLLFAGLVFSIIWLAGFSIQTYGNRVIVASDYPMSDEAFPGQKQLPADRAGLRTGDRIVQIEGEEIDHYQAIQEAVVANPGETLSMTVERNGRQIRTEITPRMDPDTGIGRIGVYAWIDPVIGRVREGSAAAAAGIEPGDRIVEVEGKDVHHSIDVISAINGKEGAPSLTIEGDGGTRTVTLDIPTAEGGAPDPGFSFALDEYRSAPTGPFGALARGFAEAGETLALTVKSIGMLFKGIKVRESLSGPIRITYYVGEVATEGFKLGIGTGFSQLFRFLSFLSVAVFFMNLLPIPILDGGLIVLFVIEGVRGKPLKPKSVYRYQTIGVTIIFGLLIFTTLNDVFFLIKR